MEIFYTEIKAELSRSEAELLAGLLPADRRTRPSSGRPGVLAAYALLRWAVARETGGHMPEIVRLDSGKPVFASPAGLHFSLSHTKTHVLCALDDAPVGCDVETVREIAPGLPARVLSAAELAGLRGVRDFFDLWCLKESYLKLRGCAPPFREISPDAGGGCIRCAGTYLMLCGGIPGCAAAVCSEKPAFPEGAARVGWNVLLRR